MRLIQPALRFALLLLCLAAAGYAQILVSLGTTTGCGSLTGGQTCTLTAAVTGTANATVTWNFSPTVAGAVLGPVNAPNSAGQTTRTYTAPQVITQKQVVTATATASDGVTSASALITLVPPSVTVQVLPAAVTLLAGQSQQFTASVFGVSSTGVTWSISPQVGSISATGNYTAPGVISTSQKITVTATSSFDGTSTGTATITLSPPVVVTVAVTPSTVTLNNSQTQQFTATVSNAQNTAVVWSITPATGAGTIDSNGLYTAPAVISATSATITAKSVQDPTKSGTATVTLAAVIGVGSGAPNQILMSQFVSTYSSNGFDSMTSLPPLGLVKVLGAFTPTAYVQEFPDANATPGVKFALATGAPVNGLVFVYQIFGGVYGYYTTLGAATVGLPTENTVNCPFYSATTTCTHQAFSSNYELFVYTPAIDNGSTFYIRNATTTETFNTEWNALGGLSGLGFPISGESASSTAAVIPPATAGSTYIVQYFSAGAIYAITSGPAKNTTHAVEEPFFDVYMAAGGPQGQYGLPTSEIQVLSSGVSQQQFEGGLLQLQPGSGGPVGQLPVHAVLISGAPGAGNVTLSVGNSLTLAATLYDATGNVLTGRVVSWSSSNGQVIQVQPNGPTAVITAVGGGTANVTATAGGVTSARLTFVVTSPCCQVGDGAPSTVQAGFQTAIARDRLTIQLPVAGPASRVGSGYIQMVQGTGSTPAMYMLAEADQAAAAYVVTGALLSAYQSLGGPAGSLGYPTSDASTGGTQLFTGGQALAGNPVVLVSGGVLAKWALLNYETGAAGAPTAAAGSFSTFGASSGAVQNFSGGVIYAASAGPLKGQSYFVTGLILTAYNAGGGASGALGMPKSDEFVTGGVHQQNFEGGTISYATGAASAQTQLSAKTAAVIVAPSSISAGGTATLAVAGFASNAAIQVTVTGRPPFSVTTATGAYTWSMYVPLNAASQTLSIHAVDTGAGVAADGTLTIRGFDTNRVQLSKSQGDNQTAAPGSLLPVPLQVTLMDASGAPVSGATVQFQSSGGSLSAGSVATDGTGHAAVMLRLPGSVGTVGVTATAPGVGQAPVTFFASAVASSLANFPNARQSGTAALGNGTTTIAQKGALLTAVAGILQYHQGRGDVPSPNGPANAAALNQFLIADCTAAVCDGFLSNTSSGEQIVNLWRAADFTGGLDVVPIAASVAAVTDLVAQGEPVLLALTLSLNGVVAGGHFVVATGINSDGSLAIQDPSALFTQSTLNGYLNGFTAGGGAWTGTLTGAVRFAVRTPSATRFLIGALSQPKALIASLAFGISSAAGPCGVPLQMLDTVDGSGNVPGAGPLVSEFLVCDGLQASYQINIGAAQQFSAFVTDLAKNGGAFDVSGKAAASYQATRPQLNLVLAPLTAGFDATAVVNAATFAAGISPGGLFSIFGTGLAGTGPATTVDFDGASAAVLLASPFQINAQVPPALGPGMHVLRVVSPFGTVQQNVMVANVSPGIFLLGGASAPAVENTDGSVNSPANPLPRGGALIIYATGLGATNKQGQFDVTAATVTAVLNGVEMPVSFSGLAPGFTGLYQVNVILPAGVAPGLGIPLTLKVSGSASNTVSVSLQ